MEFLLTYTENDLASLKSALLSGAKSISINGRTVQFLSIAELKSLIAEVEQSLAAAADPEAKPINTTRITAKFSK